MVAVITARIRRRVCGGECPAAAERGETVGASALNRDAVGDLVAWGAATKRLAAAKERDEGRHLPRRRGEAVGADVNQSGSREDCSLPDCQVPE